MQTYKNILTLLYRLFYLFICGWGILRHFNLYHIRSSLHMLSYFTIQSNVICFFIMFIIVLYMIFSADYLLERAPRILLVIKCIATLCIIVTSFSYHYVVSSGNANLAPNGSLVITVNDIFVHYATPALTLVDFILLHPKGRIKSKEPFLWLVAPIIYLIATMINSTNGVFPYPFLNFYTVGIIPMIFYIIALTAVFLILGYMLYFLDKFLYISTSYTRK